MIPHGLSDFLSLILTLLTTSQDPHNLSTFPITTKAIKITYTLKYSNHNIIIRFTDMAKQKIVVKVTMMNNDKKSRKALKIAVGLSGVESASLVGSDQITVTGEGIDSVKLTTLLRKGVGYTELVSVGNVEEKKPETKPTEVTWQINPYDYYNNWYGMPRYYGY